MKCVLTIAGSDSSGGAGIQADLKTITAHKMYGMSVITALTAQNTTGVYGIRETDAELVEKQMECVFEDICPDSVKIGMVSAPEIIEVIARSLHKYNAKNIVIDPVMVSTSGCRLISKEAQHTLAKELFPMGSIITPNIPEAEALCGFSVKNGADMINAAEEIFRCAGCAVLIKGGHLVNDASDYLFDGIHGVWFTTKRIDTANTHGTGCTLSSAIACGLAGGDTLENSVKHAKAYVSGALESGLDLGRGNGPLNHMYALLP